MTNKILDANNVHSMPDFEAFGFHVMRIRAPALGESNRLQVQVFVVDSEVSEPASVLDDANWPDMSLNSLVRVWPEDSAS